MKCSNYFICHNSIRNWASCLIVEYDSKRNLHLLWPAGHSTNLKHFDSFAWSDCYQKWKLLSFKLQILQLSASKMISLLLKIFIRIKSLEFEGDDEYYGEKLDYGGDFSPLNKLQSLSIGKTCFWNHNYPSNVKITNF